jgi:arylsulfatase A-like enzyme
MWGYDRLLEMVDEHIDQVMDELEEQGLLDDTVIIYTSDHGDGHAAHQWNQKMTFYEESINVPFIISWRGRTRAGVIDEATLSSTGLDIFSTILSLGGVPVPGNLHGIDMTPAVLAESTGRSLPERSYVVSEINQLGGIKGRMVVTQDYKYMLFDSGENREQLFDRVNDPGEMKPVTYHPEYRAQLLAHRDMLLDWDRKIGDTDFQPAGKFPDIPGAGE